jgi:hypothetical protein
VTPRPGLLCGGHQYYCIRAPARFDMRYTGGSASRPCSKDRWRSAAGELAQRLAGLGRDGSPPPGRLFLVRLLRICTTSIVPRSAPSFPLVFENRQEGCSDMPSSAFGFRVCVHKCPQAASGCGRSSGAKCLCPRKKYLHSRFELCTRLHESFRVRPWTVPCSAW